MKNLYKVFLTELLSFLIFFKNGLFGPLKKLKEVFLLKPANGLGKRGPIVQNPAKAASFIGLFLLLFGSTVSAQQLGNYPFSGFLLATCPNNNNTVSGAAANVNFSAYTNVGNICEPSLTEYQNSDLNQLFTVNTAQYNQFTVSPAAGYVLTLASLTFNHYYTVKPISNWYLRSSIDGFASNLASGSIPASSQLATVNLSPTNFTNVGAVTFRLYVSGAQNNNATWVNDNITLNGIAVKIPANPPNPTSNSPQCANPGVTLTRTGAPSGREVWYWQSSATGTSTAKPEATCTVNASGTYYIRALDTVYNLWSTGAGGLSVTITPNVGVPVFTMGPTSTRCQGAGATTYAASATANTGITYSLDATSLAAGNTIDPATGTVTYTAGWLGASTITATATGCGGPTTAAHTANTYGPVTAPVFNLGSSSVICQAPGAISYTATATYTTGITYSLDAASISGGNTVNATTGVVTYATGWSGTTTITASAAGCGGPQTSSHSVTITPTVGTPVFSNGVSSTRCMVAETVNYSATATTNTGITYSLDAASLAGGNTIDANSGNVTFAAGWSGTSIITASAAGCNGPKTAAYTVTTNPPVTTPVFSAGATSVICQGAAPVTYSATALYATGITYGLDAASLTAGNTVNTTTGAVAYTAGWIGTSVITATAAGCNGPTTASHTVTITPTVGTPVFDNGATSVRCQGAGSVAYTATASNTTGITYSLDATSQSAGNSINATTGVVTYVAGWSGTSVITASAAGCNGPVTSNHTVTITPTVGTPVFAMGTTSNRCQAAATVTYTATATNNTGITYSLDATSVAAGNSIDPSTGVVTYAAGWYGTSTITASATGCNGPSTANHTVTTNAPVTTPVFAMTGTSVRCQGAGTVTYLASASNTTGITYSLDAASVTGGNSINTSTGVVTYIAGWSGTSAITASAAGCYGPQTASHTVTITPTVGTPVFAMGATSTRCQGAGTVTYTASATTTTGITYSLDASSVTAGNTINATTGEVTYTAGWSGTSTITASAAGCNGPNTATHTVTVTATVATPVFSMGATSTRCQGAGTVTYTATATTNTGITYSLDAASLAAGITINTSIGAITYTAGWNGTSVITATATGCNGPTTASHTVTITPTVGTPVFDNGVSSVRCQGAGTVTYTATATNTTGITYTLDATSRSAGNSINAATGVVTYVAGWSGTSVITASAAGCNGPVTSNHTVTITPTVGTPVFAMGGTSNRCQAAGTVTYTATATNNTGITYSLDATSVAAGNSIDPSTGVVSYAAGWYGASTITATATGCNGPSTANHSVTTNAPVTTPVFAMTATSVRCQGAGTVTYTASATNTTGITYSLDAASVTGGNSINASTGAVTYVAGWSGTSTITASAAGCYGPQTASHTVTITATVGTPVFAMGATSTRCQGAGTVTYTASATNTTGITYSLDASSVTGGNTINATTGEVTYAAGWSGTSTINASAAGCNGPKTATHTVTVTATVGTPVFSMGTTSTRCQGAGSVTYTASATTNTGITYSLDAASVTAGITINVSTGTVTYVAGWNGSTVITATATGCNGPTTANHTVTITPTVGTPVFSLAATSTRCQGAGSVTYTATATNTTGITYSLDATSRGAGNSINASTGVVTYVAGWSGTSVITASAAGCNGPVTNNHTVTITPTVGTPVFAMGTTSNRCQAAATVTYTATATNNTGITYSLDATSVAAGNSIDPSTGTVTYAAAWYGTSTITATASGCNGPSTANHTVTTNAPVTTPVFAMSATSVRCQGAGAVTYTASASNTTGITYSLDAASITGGNSINASTGVVTYVAGWSGTSTITASAAGCYGPQTATHTVTITPTVGTPVFAIGATSTRCQGVGTVTYTATATNTTGITYSLDPSSLTAGNTINASTGEVTYAAGWSGTSTITASAAGCNGPKTAIHTVTVTATVGTPVFSMGATSTRCRAASTVTYTATATNNTGITYSVDAASLSAGNTINAATGAVTYVSGWYGTTIITATATGCNGPSSSSHTVTTNDFVTVPVFAIGTSSSRCQGSGTVTYTATASNTTGITYSLDASSVSGGNSINAATGVVTYAAGWSGTTIITASAAGCSGPKTTQHTVTVIPTVGLPVFALGATSSRCQDAGTVTYTATSTNSTGISYSLDATSIAAGNSINSSTGDVTYISGWNGTSIITASADGCNGPRTSTHTVTTNGLVGIPVFDFGPNSIRCSGPDNIFYRADAINTTGITYSIDAASIAAGVSINSSNGRISYQNNYTGTVIITATAQGCSGPTTSTHIARSYGTMATPSFTLGASSSRCIGPGTTTYTANATNAVDISYSLDATSAAAGNTINTSNGTVTFTATWNGTTTIKATATSCSGSTLVATHTVSTTANVGIPVFSMGATSTRCQGSGTVTYTATATTNTGIAYALDATSLAGGNTINASTGAVTYAGAWIGTSVITATATGCNGPTTASHTVTITPTVGTPVFDNGASSVRCQGAGSVTYTATATNTTGITYSLDATSRSAGNSINAATGVVTYVAGWSGTSVITASAAGCNGPVTSNHTVTITPTVGTPVFAMGATSNRCQAAGTVTYTATATNNTGITYSLDATSVTAGNSIDPLTGAVTYAAGWYGTSTITATATGCNGPSTANHTVTTNAPVTTPVFAMGATSVRCQGAGAVTYTATASNTTGITYSLDAASIAGGNSINTSTGAVTYVAGWSGTSTITASAAGCYGPQTATHTVTITPTVGTPVFAMGATSTRCQGAGTVTYTASATNTTGITYSLDAGSVTGGNTINATTGEVTFAAGWSGTSTINASAAGCNGPKTATHTVTVTATVGTPVFSMGATSTRCQGAGSVTYTASATTNTGITYSLDAASVTAGITINVSTGTVTYVAGWNGSTVITATATGCNGPTTANHTVTITPTVGTPVFSLAATSTRCQGAGSVTYTATATNTTGITYSLDATSRGAGNSINASTGVVTYVAGWSGTSVITASAAGCNGPVTNNHTVTITPTVGTPVFAMGTTSNRCQAAATVTYTATATNNTGITYSLDATSVAAGNSIDPSTGTVTYAAAWYGTSTITATASGCNGPSTANHTVTTNAPVTTPVFAMSATSVRCQGAGAVTYTASASNTTGITYSLDAASITGGNSINTSTGAVTYIAGWSGTSTITASAAGCYGPQTASHTVTITPTVGTPVFAMGATSSRCQGAGTVTYTASATNTTGITYSLDASSVTAGNTINATTGEITYAAGWSGTSTITASAAGCNGPKTATHTVTVTTTVGTPVFSMGATSTRCQGAGTVTYSATATTNTGIAYALDATSLAGGNTINASTGAVTYVAGWSGTSVITVTATGCNGPSTANHTVTITPTVGTPVFDMGPTSTRCQGAGTVAYSATATTTTGITYSLNAASITGGNSINASTGVVTYAAGWSGTSVITASAAGCNGPATSTHTVTITPTVGTPVFAKGTSSTICQASGTVAYTATATNNTGITYSLDATSVTAGNTIDASTGAVTYAVTWYGTSTITATATGCNGPKTSAHTVTITATVGTPVFTLGATSTRCQGAGTVTYSATATTTTGITYTLDAASLAAGNTINSSTGAITYVAAWSGTSVITASAAGCSGPSTANHTVTITPTVGTPAFTLGSTSTRCQGAATVNYAASATNATAISYSLDATSRTAGNTINSATGDVTYIAGWSGTSTITASATGCNGPKTATHTVTVTASVGTPVFSSGATSTRCQGSGTVTYTATATTNTGITYSLDAASLTGGNTINASTGVVTYSAAWSGTTVITATATGCNGPATANHTVTVTATVGTPVFSFGAASTRCQGAATVTYAATATNSTGITYSMDATSTSAGNSINSATGAVTYVAGWKGTTTITARAAGCNGPVTSTHTVTITPTVGTPVFTQGAASTICQGAGAVTYTASATNTTGITYSLDAASISGNNTINATTGTVTYDPAWTGTTMITATATGCNGPATTVHTVNITPTVGTPVFSMGPASARTQAAGTVTYSAWATTTTGINYTLDAASVAAGNSINSITGAVTYTAGWNGTSIITANAAGCNGPATASHTVNVNPLQVTVPLYLSDPSQSLDRIDPVNTNDLTTAQSQVLSTVSSTVALDNTSFGSGRGNSVTVSHTTGTGVDRLMLVGISYSTTNAAAIQSVTYGGVALQQVGTLKTDGTETVAIYKLLSPVSGAANVVVNFNPGATGGAVVGVSTYSGVDMTNPLNTYSSVSGNRTDPSFTVASATNEQVFSVVGANAAITAVSGTGLWTSTQTNINGAGANQAGNAVANISYSIGGNNNQKLWVAAGVSVRPSSTITSTTFTQNPVLCGPLTIKAGTITVTNYISIASGAMPVNPVITADISYGGTNLITINNPTYNSSTGVLKFSGNLPADVTIPAGQAISLRITSAQPGVGFKIDFDSKTKPSKIDFPVSSFIDITSLGVYKTPYPGGSAVISDLTNNTVYVRTTVNDPFGVTDITGLNLAITPPGSNVTPAVVATSGCSQTYEYAWSTPAASGNYNLSASAKQGFENTVTSVETTNFSLCTNCPPVAVNDSATGAGGAPVQVDVLANDYDPNNNINASSLTVLTEPQNGTVFISKGMLVYVPNGSYSGNDTLTYQICDSTAPTPLCATGTLVVTINPLYIDPCSEANLSHLYYIPYPEEDVRTALIASSSAPYLPMPSNNIRTIISLKMPYPSMIVTWDHWEDGYESDILNPVQSTTAVWGDGNPYNGIAPGYSDDIIPAGGSIVFDNTVPVSPRVATDIFYDGRDKIQSSGQIAVTQVCGEPSRIGVQAMKTNVTATSDFGQAFTVPAGQNFPSKDFAYTAMFVRSASNNNTISIDKDNNGTFETIATLNEGQSLLVDGNVLSGATLVSTDLVGVDLHFGGVDGFSSREVPIYPATWYSNVYYTPVPTTKSPDSAVVMLYNSLNRPINIKWSAGNGTTGTINLPGKTVNRFPLNVSATAAYKFENLTKESFTAIEIVDSYTPGYTGAAGQNDGSTYDWSFNLIAEARLTTFATIAWAPGSTDGSVNHNPLWVTPAGNTTVYVKYNGDIQNGALVSPCGLHYDVSYTLNALNYKKLLDTDNDQSGLAVYTCDGTKIAAVYGEDPSVAGTANPSWDVGSTIQPFCAVKLIFGNDDYAYTLVEKPVTIPVLKNDAAFLAVVDPASVTTAGLQQPKHGTVTVNANGTLLYTPEAGFIGLDTLEYSVCSTPSPIKCDIATVFIKVAFCPTPANQNIISGQVFLDKNKDGVNNDGGAGLSGTKVYLYTDANCNATIDVNEVTDSVTVDNSGSYQFVTYPERIVADNFDNGSGGTTCATGNDGNTTWATPWTDKGDPSVGFCVTPAQSYGNTNVEIIKDAYGYAIRLKNPSASATRVVNLGGASAAFLSFSYRRASTTLTSGHNIIVQASKDGSVFGTIYTILGGGKKDNGYVNIYNQDITAYATANTYIRFLTNPAVGNADTVYIDNVSVSYLKYPICYITQISSPSIPNTHYLTTVSQHAFSATTGGSCLNPFDFGVTKKSISIGGSVYHDANGITDGLINGTLMGAPAGTALFAYLVDTAGKVAFKTTVNTSTGAYVFPLADVYENYKVVLSASDSALYSKAPASPNFPTGWVSVGESYGTNNTAGTGIETGKPNSSIAVNTGGVNITAVNFGIEQQPTGGTGTITTINPGLTVSFTVPASVFTNVTPGSDPSPGTISNIRISTFPANVTNITINNVTYNSSTFPASGVTIPATATGQPTQPISVDPLDGTRKVVIAFYAIDNAGVESAATGSATVKFLSDVDRDGIDDTQDIDDDNDGIPDVVEICGNGATTFACLPGGTDPSADNDNDGILNYQDYKYGVLNSAGCVAILDSDGDGVPDYLDADSDNDGIPDVVEAGGADADGNGVIDSYTDTDGDGLSQNVDGSSTGAAGSGNGLGNVDFDADGVPNQLDLDSDNDGIPDIVEACATDANNDGRVDGFFDANGNGLLDDYEMTGAIMKTSPDLLGNGRAQSYPNKNADGIGKPNPYDLDADGDGIADAVEARFNASVTITNGTVNGARSNGWATSISSLPALNLANTDWRGQPDFLDIDSDDDGISDNIEGQPTFSYILPVDTDTDDDGIADSYDVNVNTFGGAGISPYDHDYDGDPDYIDFDTDNDGAPDINEASMIFNIDQLNINATDTDGDGMVDQYDGLNINTLTTANKYKNVTNSQMGVNGGWNGPLPTGSSVQLIRSFTSGDRDWRASYVLPLPIINFSGTLENNVSKLTWKVENEGEVAEYVLERSKDGVTFEPVVSVKPQYTTSSTYNYADDISTYNADIVYYRIRQVNKNGQKSYSRIISFKKIVKEDIVIKVYPNPVVNSFTINISSLKNQHVDISVMDASGKLVLQKTAELEKGINLVKVSETTNMSKGVYLVVIVAKKAIYFEKLVKE